MGRVSKDQIEQIVNATDIISVLNTYLKIKRIGSNYVALCPFHEEKTPSFNISASKQRYHCFGCGEGGNVITFLMEYEKISFIDALKRLAENAGIQIIESKVDKEKQSKRSSLLNLHNKIKIFFCEELIKEKKSSEIVKYLQERDIGSEVIEKWGLGFVPNSNNKILSWAKNNKINISLLSESGILLKSDYNDGYYSRFKSRIIFPIFNEFGEVIAFSGRSINKEKKIAKYINSPATEIFEKSKVLYGLNFAKNHIHKSDYVILCEGQIDVIRCHHHKIKNAVAPLGTAFTASHAKLLRRHTSNIYIAYDNDSAGFKAAEKTYRILSESEFIVKIINMEKGHDPDSFIRKFGVEKFKEKIQTANDFIEFQLDYLTSNADINKASDKISILKTLCDNLSIIKNPIIRESSIISISGHLQISIKYIKDEINKITLKNKKFNQSNRELPHSNNQKDNVQKKIIISDQVLLDLIRHMLLDKNFIEKAREFEYINDIVETLPHANIIEIIMESDIDTNSPASVESIVHSLPEIYRYQIGGLLMKNLPKKESNIAEELLSKLYYKTIKLKISQKKTLLSNNQTTDYTTVYQELLDLKQLLSNIYINNNYHNK